MGKSSFNEDINYLKKNNQAAESFFKRYDELKKYVSDDKFGIKQWANNIKHQGGFVTSEILKEDNAYVQCLKDNRIVFSTEWLYPFCPSFDEIIMRIEKQKDNLVQFMDWLFDSVFGDTRIIDMKAKPKLFSAGRCNQNIKSSTIYPYNKISR